MARVWKARIQTLNNPPYVKLYAIKVIGKDVKFSTNVKLSTCLHDRNVCRLTKC